MKSSRLLVRVAVAAAVAAAAPAEAQNLFVVTPVSPSPPLFPAPPYNPPLFPQPLVNATTHRVPSSLYLQAVNQAGGQPVRRVDFQLQAPYTPSGGAGPAGWAVVRVDGGHVVFEAPSCAAGTEIAPGQTATFRIDAQATGGMKADTIDDRLAGVNATDQVAGGTVSCGGTNSTEDRTQAQWTRKGIQMTAVAAPASGGSPLTTTVTFALANKSDNAWTVRLCGSYSAGACVSSPTVYQNGTIVSLAPQSCAPASLALAKYGNAGDSGSITCTYALGGAGSSFQFAATADNGLAPGANNYTSAAGALSNLVVLGDATATFALDSLNAGQLSTVRATLTVTNNTALAITITPLMYAQLSKTGLTQLSGTRDPRAASVKAGASQTFVYSFTVNGAVGTSYGVSGKAVTSAGDTNVAVTPPGTVGGYSVTWSPSALVPGRVGTPRGRPNLQFTATVKNNTGTPVQEIDIVNPQDTTWTGIANVSVTPSSAGGAAGFNNPKVSSPGNSTITTLQYQWHNANGQTGLAPGASATIVVSFTAIGPVSPTPYPFQVVVLPVNFGNGSQPTMSASVLVENAVADLASFTLLQTPGAGQTAYWHNTPDPDPNNDHDGVVLFRAASGTAPGFPVDGTDYTQSPPATVVYSDRGGSTEVSFTDAVSGAFNYRLCNVDRYLVYSNCSTGFWNGAGWLDSGTAPAGGWMHAFGYQVLLYPGIVPGGRVGFASNAPALNVLTAANGQRPVASSGTPFDPVGLAATPALGTPMVTLSNGRQVLFAADQGGRVTALDVQAGELYWQAAATGESFVAGVSGALRQYASAAFQAIYPNDVLFLGSTTGRLLALDATTGATLWTANPGKAIRALPLYDYASNWLYVPTDDLTTPGGAGILAYDLGSVATPPSPAEGWVKPGGNYRLGCTRADLSTQMTCVDNSGGIEVLERSTGVAVASGTFTGAPSSVWKVAGGLVVGSASRVQTFTISGGTFTLAGTFAPSGTTLSEIQVFGAAGFIFVGGSDLKLHKLNLADASEVLPAVAVTSQQAGTFLGPAVFDVASNLFVFGASDGRVWAVPYF